MSIRRMFAGLCIVVSTVLLFILLLELLAATQTKSELKKINDMAVKGKDSSEISLNIAVKTQSELQQVSSSLKSSVERLNRVSQKTQIVEKKVKQVAQQVRQLRPLLEDAMKYVPEGNALYNLEDALDELASVEDLMQRESKVLLEAAVSDLDLATIQMQDNTKSLTNTNSDMQQVTQSALLTMEGNGSILNSISEFTSEFNSKMFETILAMIFGGLITVGCLIALMHLVTKPLDQLRSIVWDMAQGEGDLTVRLKDDRKDELGDLAKGVNKFIEKLQTLIKTLRQETESLKSFTITFVEAANSSNDAATTQQAQIELAATAIDQMIAAIQDVAKFAEQASETSANTDKEAQNGHKFVVQNVEAMQKLNQDVDHATLVIKELESNTKDIDTVLEVIRAVAEQTNLLALNAAIEAARAGEQGRGFAVVADEVRSLASRTHASTQEINTIIDNLRIDSQRAVTMITQSKDSTGKALDQASQIGQLLQSISEGVNRISGMNNSVAASAEEQSQMSTSIGENVKSIRSSSQNTLRSAETVLTSSSEVNLSVDKISQLIDRFKV